MPNSANRSNGGNNASKGQPKHDTTRTASQKPNTERSDRKHGDSDKDRRGDTGRTSSQGRKSASGGSAED
ncbi:hypothetical protein [Flavisolibacter nicotianae]|uniref:hypothetical protein n=1 Tax=Flavisolibacter nicotianae TaxID=2364882 RepID=UPI000EAC14B0|nr:hypothetical protein [Flavisolibacter nicotianae]